MGKKIILCAYLVCMFATATLGQATVQVREEYGQAVATIHPQMDSPPEAALRQLDFGLVRVGVANPRRGAKSASSFVEVYGGFSINSIAGCTVILRNEGLDKGRRFVYDVVIPLAELSGQGHVGQAAGEVGPPGSDMGQEFYPWSIAYDVRSRSRRVTLHDRIRKRILARGAHVSFSVRERSVLDKIEEAFGKAIGFCNQL